MSLFIVSGVHNALIVGCSNVKTRPPVPECTAIDTLPARPDPNFSDMVDGALEWWALAGVDADFSAEPHDWLAPAEPAPVRPVAPPRGKHERTALDRALGSGEATFSTAFGGPRDAWPARLDEFADFWTSEPSLGIGAGRRIPPRGPANAQVMVFVAMPEEGDTDTLLGGREGRLLDAFLAATDCADDAYVASLLPCRSVSPDWTAFAENGGTSFARHHVLLAKPERLIVFGKAMTSALGLTPGDDTLDGVPVLIVPRLDRLLRQPRQRKALWDRWLDWTAR